MIFRAPRWAHILAGFVLFLGISVYYVRLFYPVQQLIVTPDFGRSDALDLSIATKYSLWQSLQHNSLPIWIPQAGNGLPMMSEGHPGALYAVNLVLYRVFDFVTAYNLSLFLAAFLFALGTYCLLISFGISIPAALFGGLTAGMSGTLIPHLTHITLLQGFSLLPWELFFLDRFLKRRSVWDAVLFIVIAAEQILSGFAQAFFISYQLVSAYFLFRQYRSRPILKTIGTYILLTVPVFLLAAVQLYPMLEFSRFSTDPNGFDLRMATFFSYPLKHLVTMLDPFLLGNPSVGTYPDFNAFGGSIFWENTGYIGVIPLVLIAVAFGWHRIRRTFLTPLSRFFLAASGAALLLMPGKNTPVYIIFSVWPFDLFRVPSRYIWVFAFSLTVLASLAFDRLVRVASARRLITAGLGAVIGLQYLMLVNTWWNYHLIMPAADWMAPPVIHRTLRPDARIIPVYFGKPYNDIFLSKGWRGKGEEYLRLRSLLSPNSNLLWDITSLSAYGGRTLKRQTLVETYITQSLDFKHNTATASAETDTLLALYGITDVVSGIPITWNAASESAIPVPGSPEIRQYHTGNVTRQIYLAPKTFRMSDYYSAYDLLHDPDFSATDSAIIEGKPLPVCTLTGGETVIAEPSGNGWRFRFGGIPCTVMAVVNMSYYPFIHAQLDGRDVPFEPANINQVGVRIPTGTHTLSVSVRPVSIEEGATVSLAALILLLSGAALHTRLWRRRSGPGTAARSGRRPDSRGR